MNVKLGIEVDNDQALAVCQTWPIYPTVTITMAT